VSPALDERGLPPGYRYHPEWEIVPRDVAASLAGPTPPLLVDVRTEAELAIVRIPGAMHVPLHELERRLDDLKDAIGERDGAAIVTVCHHGMRSMRAAAVLRAAGLGEVRSLAGGIHLWALDIAPGMPTY
jgi:rhodanese-related sulfurtransferase